MKVLRRDDDWNPSPRRIPRILMRVGVAGALAGAFVAAALLVEPSPSPAGNARSMDAPADLDAETEATDEQAPDRVSLGALEGLEHSLLIHATPEGPRYTLLDPLGNPIATDLPADEVYRVHPDADVDRMIAGPLMLADID
ncbi:MAG: hypothetical protein ACF8QF_03755 [Phycisphaerales bacterium]